MSIHADFVQFLADSGVQTQTVDVEGIVRLVSKIAEQAASHSQSIPREMQEVVSRVLAKIAQSGEFSLNDSHAPLCFIPCLHRGKALLLPPNAKSDGKGSAHVFLGSNRSDPEQYDRSFIFAPEEREQEWLPRESKDATRFLNLVGCTKEQVGPVCQMLHLIDLESKDGPTNFVRHFLSERGGSLFFDENLAKFLDSRDPRLLASQKRTYTRALRAYFDGPKTEKYLKPEDMGKLRCLYRPFTRMVPGSVLHPGDDRSLRSVGLPFAEFRFPRVACRDAEGPWGASSA